jgi:hypothetical protein
VHGSERRKPTRVEKEPAPERREPAPLRQERAPEGKETARNPKEPGSELRSPGTERKELAPLEREPAPERSDPAPLRQERAPEGNETVGKRKEPPPLREEDAAEGRTRVPIAEEPRSDGRDPVTAREEPGPWAQAGPIHLRKPGSEATSHAIRWHGKGRTHRSRCMRPCASTCHVRPRCRVPNEDPTEFSRAGSRGTGDACCGRMRRAHPISTRFAGLAVGTLLLVACSAAIQPGTSTHGGSVASPSDGGASAYCAGLPVPQATQICPDGSFASGAYVFQNNQCVLTYSCPATPAPTPVPPICNFALPSVCEVCSSGETVCAHYAIQNGMCFTEICPPTASPPSAGCFPGAPCTPGSGCGGGSTNGCLTSCSCDPTGVLQCTSDCDASVPPTPIDAGAPCIPGPLQQSTLGGLPNWPCFQSACPAESAACDNDCQCNNDVVAALQCVPTASAATCFSPLVSSSNPAETAFLMCLITNMAKCGASPDGGSG